MSQGGRVYPRGRLRTFTIRLKKSEIKKMPHKKKSKNFKFKKGDLVLVRLQRPRLVPLPAVPRLSNNSYGIVIEHNERYNGEWRILGMNGNKCWYPANNLKLIARAK